MARELCAYQPASTAREYEVQRFDETLMLATSKMRPCVFLTLRASSAGQYFDADHLMVVVIGVYWHV
jgi:hypothetical protein